MFGGLEALWYVQDRASGAFLAAGDGDVIFVRLLRDADGFDDPEVAFQSGVDHCDLQGFDLFRVLVKTVDLRV